MPRRKLTYLDLTEAESTRYYELIREYKKWYPDPEPFHMSLKYKPELYGLIKAIIQWWRVRQNPGGGIAAAATLKAFLKALAKKYRRGVDYNSFPSYPFDDSD